MSVCAIFQLPSLSRSGIKVPGGVVGCWCVEGLRHFLAFCLSLNQAVWYQAWVWPYMASKTCFALIRTKNLFLICKLIQLWIMSWIKIISYNWCHPCFIFYRKPLVLMTDQDRKHLWHISHCIVMTNKPGMLSHSSQKGLGWGVKIQKWSILNKLRNITKFFSKTSTISLLCCSLFMNKIFWLQNYHGLPLPSNCFMLLFHC